MNKFQKEILVFKKRKLWDLLVPPPPPLGVQGLIYN